MEQILIKDVASALTQYRHTSMGKNQDDASCNDQVNMECVGDVICFLPLYIPGLQERFWFEGVLVARGSLFTSSE